MLSIQNVTKHYQGHTALNGVSIELKKGIIFGLLGPNGAGKTSLIRIINQITAPDSGTVLFNGEPLAPKHIAHIGYLPEERGLYKQMKIGDQMLYLAQLKGMSKAEATAKCKYWFEKMEIQTWWTKKVEELSKGMQQKVQFIATVLHEPQLLILDEPFSGFDPVNADLIKNEILELNKKGTTIIFSTHRMESVEELCSEIALINRGQKILDGNVWNIKKQFSGHEWLLETDQPVILPEHLLNHTNTYTTQSGNMAYSLSLHPGVNSNEVLAAILPQCTIMKYELKLPSINEIFIKLITNA